MKGLGVSIDRRRDLLDLDEPIVGGSSHLGLAAEDFVRKVYPEAVAFQHARYRNWHVFEREDYFGLPITSGAIYRTQDDAWIAAAAKVEADG